MGVNLIILFSGKVLGGGGGGGGGGGSTVLTGFAGVGCGFCNGNVATLSHFHFHRNDMT